MDSPVLISWIAVNNDPYEREQGSHDTYRRVDGRPVAGPTLTLLFDKASDYAGRIKDVVLLHRHIDGPRGDRERSVVEQTKLAIEQLEPGLLFHSRAWNGDDPTDHQQIFAFLRETLPDLRRRFAGRELVIHISPGTPSMHTVWVLMAETGLIADPFSVVKSLRESERRGRRAVLPVRVGIETFYKAYMAARPRQLASHEQAVIWDPARFQSERMQRLFAEARRFAPLKVPVLLLGERGTGKTTLAAWIRQHSPFRRQDQDRSWPSVACGQYSAETMRSELFGHTKGAFTGASHAKPGLLASADRDTLFLDEVGDVSRDVQRLLIRALEEKTYLPLGAEQFQASDFRLLTATNVEQPELGERLDADFLDRISSVTLRLPALREIPEELPWLWESAYEAAAQRVEVGAVPSALEPNEQQRLISALASHPLPGNMRDLFRVAYRLLAARNDVHQPLAPSDAVDYALEGLDVGLTPLDGTGPARAVARAFADASPLDAILEKWGSISTETLDLELKEFLGAELRRLAAARNQPVDELCDKTERTVRTWVRRGTESSVERKPTSGSRPKR